MAGRPTGRPTKFTEDSIVRYLDARRLGMTIKDCGALADWSEGVTRLFLTRGRDARDRRETGERLTPRDTGFLAFVEADEKAEAEFRRSCHAVILRAAQNPNHWQAAMTILERRWPEDYGRRIVDVNAEVKGTVQVDVRASELLERLRALTSGGSESNGHGVLDDPNVIDVEEA